MAGFRSSLTFSYLGKYLMLVLQFVTSIILGRLLTPADIGIYTVAAVFVGLGHLMREFGINLYIVQEKDLTEDRIRAAFTLNTLFGWGVALALFLARDAIGAFYASEAVRQVVGLLCINFLLVPMGAITFAHIRREMRFHHTLIIQVGAALVQAIVGIVSAYLGQAYMSMVWSAIASTVSSVFLTFWFRAPGLPLWPGFREIPHVLAFCKYAGPNALINHIGSSAPDWVLGKILGMSAVGLFSRATGTIALFSRAFMEGLAGVSLPHFAKQHRDGAIDRKGYLMLNESVVAVAWPFFATLAVLGDPVIRILFGPQWAESVPALRILCAGAILLYTTSLVEQVLVATGNVRLQLGLNIGLQALTVLATVVSASYGLAWAAIALAGVGVVRLFAYQIASQRILALGFSAFLAPFARSALLALLTVSIPAVALVLRGDVWLGSIWRLAAVAMAAALAWLAGVWLLRCPLRVEISNLFRVMRKRYFRGA